MLNLIYSEYLQKLFTNRKKELKLLELLKEELRNGKQIRVSFFGLRRTGKSLILKEFLKKNLHENDVRVVYLNFEEFTTNPEDFALNYVGRICFWVSKAKRIEDFTTHENLLVNAPEEIRHEILSLITLLKEERVNRTALLNMTFSFPSLLAEKLNLKIIILLDEFQKILEISKFRNCRNILDIFRAKIEANNVTYVISGSAISIMHNIVADHASPLFDQFKEESIENFDRISARELVGKIIKCDLNIKDFIYSISYGHPFYINAISTRVKILNEIYDLKINRELVKKAFVIELLSKKSEIYKHCEYIYDISLERAKYSNSLKGVLKILARNEGLNQSQVARKLKVTQGAMRTYLNSLMNVDIIFERDNKYFFKDKILQYWLCYREYGIEISEFPKEKIINALVNELEEKYLRASTELGKAKEYELKDKLEKQFELKLSNYLKDNIEFDLVGLKENTHHIFEIKWRNKPVDYKDIKNFLDKIKKSEFKDKNKKLFFISKSGFTKQATDILKKNEIEKIEM